MEMLGQESRKAFTNLTVKGKKSFRSWSTKLQDCGSVVLICTLVVHGCAVVVTIPKPPACQASGTADGKGTTVPPLTAECDMPSLCLHDAVLRANSVNSLDCIVAKDAFHFRCVCRYYLQIDCRASGPCFE